MHILYVYLDMCAHLFKTFYYYTFYYWHLFTSIYHRRGRHKAILHRFAIRSRKMVWAHWLPFIVWFIIHIHSTSHQCSLIHAIAFMQFVCVAVCDHEKRGNAFILHFIRFEIQRNRTNEEMSLMNSPTATTINGECLLCSVAYNLSKFYLLHFQNQRRKNVRKY